MLTCISDIIYLKTLCAITLTILYNMLRIWATARLIYLLDENDRESIYQKMTKLAPHSLCLQPFEEKGTRHSNSSFFIELIL